MAIITRTISYTTADGVALQSYLCLPEQAADELSGVYWLRPNGGGRANTPSVRPSGWPRPVMRRW